MERATAPLQPESPTKVFRPRLAPHLWTITVKHRDGSKVILHSDELPGDRLTISPSLMGRKITTAMRFYVEQFNANQRHPVEAGGQTNAGVLNGH